MRRTSPTLACFLAVGVLVAGCGGDDGGKVASVTTTEKTSTTVAPTASGVTDLMANAGCQGEVIGTQLFSKETGRCTMPNAVAADQTVTVAVFASNDLRDKWLKAAGEFGGNAVHGDHWAAVADGAADAQAFLAGQP